MLMFVYQQNMHLLLRKSDLKMKICFLLLSLVQTRDAKSDKNMVITAWE